MYGQSSGPRTSAACTVQDLSAAGAATPPDCAGSAFLLNGCGPAKAEGTPSAEECEDSGGLLAGCVVSAALPGQAGTKQIKPYVPMLEPCNVSAVAQAEGGDSASKGIAVEVFVGVLIGSIVATALFTTLVVLTLTAPKGESKAARVVRTLHHINPTMTSSEIKVPEVSTAAKPASLQPQASLNFEVESTSVSAQVDHV